MYPMKTLTFGVGAAALAGAIGFIYAQATSEEPLQVPGFGYTARQATPMDVNTHSTADLATNESPSVSPPHTNAPRQDKTDSRPGGP